MDPTILKSIDMIWDVSDWPLQQKKLHDILNGVTVTAIKVIRVVRVCSEKGGCTDRVFWTL